MKEYTAPAFGLFKHGLAPGMPTLLMVLLGVGIGLGVYSWATLPEERTTYCFTNMPALAIIERSTNLVDWQPWRLVQDISGENQRIGEISFWVKATEPKMFYRPRPEE